MSGSQMRQLSAATARMLSSGQVILGPESVVKELLENSIDAGASKVDVRLDSCGLDRLEVLDNGRGFSAEDAELVAMRHCTSKLADDSKLTDLATYGFRGEALNSLCSVGQLSMATRCQGEELGREYAFDKTGQVVSRRSVAMPPGTRTTVRQLFHCLPVRRQQLRAPKRLREALASVESVIQSAALANPGVRLALLSDGEMLLSLPDCASLDDRVRQVLGYAVWQQLRRVERPLGVGEGGGRIVAYLPISGADKAMVFRSGELHCFFIINRRPVQSAKLAKAIRSTISTAFGVPAKLPFCVLSLELPADSLDVNLNAAKTQVGLANEAALLDTIKAMLTEECAAPSAAVDPSLADVSNTVGIADSALTAACNSAPVSKDVSAELVESAAAAAAELVDDRPQPLPVDATAVAMQGGAGTDIMQLIDLTVADDSASAVADCEDSPLLKRKQPQAVAASDDSPRPAKRRKLPADSTDQQRVGINASTVSSPPAPECSPTPVAVPTYSDLASMHRRRYQQSAPCPWERLRRLTGALHLHDALNYQPARGSHCSEFRYIGRLCGPDRGFLIGVDSAGGLHAVPAASGADSQSGRDDAAAAMRRHLDSAGGQMLARLPGGLAGSAG